MEKSKDSGELKLISISELKACKGFEDLSDEQAINIIYSIKELSLMIHQIVNDI